MQRQRQKPKYREIQKGNVLREHFPEFDKDIFLEAVEKIKPDSSQNRYDPFQDHEPELANQSFQDVNLMLHHKKIYTLDELPDESDEILSDYKLKTLLGTASGAPPTFVDLDTAPDYVDFVKNSIKNMLASENEFNDDSLTEIISKLRT